MIYITANVFHIKFNYLVYFFIITGGMCTVSRYFIQFIHGSLGV